MKHEERAASIDAAVKKLQKAGATVNVSAVARELGITPALIHKDHPVRAEAIRVLKGGGTRKKAAKKDKRIRSLKKRLAESTADLREAKKDIVTLASHNLALKKENEALKALCDERATPIKR